MSTNEELIAEIEVKLEFGLRRWQSYSPTELLLLSARNALEALLPKEVKTVEELEEMPVGSVLRDSIGNIWERVRNVPGVMGDWETIGSEWGAEASDINLPVHVLFTSPQNGDPE